MQTSCHLVRDIHKRPDKPALWAQKGLSILLLASLAAILPLNGCSPIRSEQLTPVPMIAPSPTQSSYSFSLTEISVDEAIQHFQDPVSREKLNGIDARIRTGFHSTYTVARFGSTDGQLTSGVSAVLKPGESFMGYLLIISTHEHAHDIGFLATLDYEPLQINYDGMPQTLPVARFEPGTTRAFRFSLSSLPEGLHTLVITYVIDPDRVFTLDPTRFDPEANEAMGLRTGPPYELGVLLFVTPKAPRAIADWPPRARAFPPDQTVRLDAARLLEESLPGHSSQLLTTATVKAGEVVIYYAKFLGPADPGEWSDMSVRVLVFWDEILFQTDDLAVPVQATAEGQLIPYPIHVPAGLERGEHTLMVIAYPYPGYLRFWRSEDGGELWIANATYFGYLMARLPVTVEHDSL